MATIKTAISIQKALFDQIDSLAREMKVSRSRVIALAIERYIREQQDRQLFDKINAACEAASPDKAEQEQLRHMRRHQKRLVEGKW